MKELGLLPTEVVWRIVLYLSHPNASRIKGLIADYKIGGYNTEYRFGTIRWRPLLQNNRVDEKWVALQIAWLDLRRSGNVQAFLRKMSVGLPQKSVDCTCCASKCALCFGWYT